MIDAKRSSKTTPVSVVRWRQRAFHAALAVLMCRAGTLMAQDVFVPPPLLPSPYAEQPLRDFSWIYIDPVEPQEIRVHDILTIIVDEKAEVISNSRFDRQRTGTFKAELKEFMRIGEDGTLDPAALNAPSIDAQLQNRLSTTGTLRDQEGIRYRIAATVVDVLPNGTLVLEARKSIQTNHELWEYRLTGRIDSNKIALNRTALSEDIAELKIVRFQRGKIFDSTKRGWGTYLLDKIWPF